MAALSVHPRVDAPTPARARVRSNSLRHVASAVFAMTAVLPLLIFVWTLHRLDALSQAPSQVGLGLALAMALVGFAVFRRLMAQMSELIQAIGMAVERGVRATVPPATASPPAVPRASPRAAAPVPLRDFGVPTSPLPPPARHDGPPTPPLPPPRAAATPATGLGAIREVDDLGRAIATLWQAEAAAFLGRRVLVSVMNVPRQIDGTLIEVSDHGLLLETEQAERVAVSYRRISAIDAGSPSA